MTRTLFVLLAFLLYGCDLEPRFPRDNSAVIYEGPIVIDATPVDLPADAAKVVGQSNEVCLSLGSGSAGPHDKDEIQREVARFVREATFTVVAMIPNGEKFEFSGPSYAWSKTGRFVESNEISICFWLRRQDAALVEHIETLSISSTKNVDVIGIYWASTNAFDEAN